MKTLFKFMVLTILIIPGCDKDVVLIMDRETFEKEKMLWESQSLINYQFAYVVSSGSFGSKGPITQTVQDNEISSFIGRGEYKNISEIYEYLSRMFDDVETETNDGKKYKIKSITLNISYNTQYHYPEKVSLGAQYETDVDGGMDYHLNITEFKLLD